MYYLAQHQVEYNVELFESLENAMPFLQLVYDSNKILESNEFGLIGVLPNMLSLIYIYIYIDDNKYGSSGAQFQKLLQYFRRF